MNRLQIKTDKSNKLIYSILSISYLCLSFDPALANPSHGLSLYGSEH
ncbi:uncharacterized protein METZ01_LOCUS253876, partial [marine metagenome]